MTEATERRGHNTFTRWSPALLIAGLWLFHAVNNWVWLSKNVVIRGWDRIGALVNSLYYHGTLSEFSLQALFNATVQDAIRPPLFGMSMAAMCRLFGVSADVAVMVNVGYLLILLAASYGIGKKLGGRRAGLLGATLVALVPMVFAMSRYSYFEFSLAAFTTLSIYLLLASDRFERRSTSLLLGVAMGLGFLIKRTFPVFVLGALVVVFVQGRLARKLWSRLLSRPRPRWRDVGLAVGGGLLLSTVWYLPNHDAAQQLSAGYWLLPIWWALATTTILFALQAPSPETNFLTCGFLSLSIASAWYAPQGFEFITRLLRTAWGVRDPRGRAVDYASLDTYGAYLQSILYGFSLVFVVLLLVAIGLVLANRISRRRRLLPVPWWGWGWWAGIIAVVVAYAILTTSIYKEDRAITPVLPMLAILLAAALLKLPWQRLRVALIALAIIFGLVQFFAISYTGPHWLVERTRFGRPVLGQWGLFTQGLYLETPDSGQNNPEFWIADDVLERVEATRQREGWGTISLGIIAYSSHVHAGTFAYDQIRLYPSTRLEDPTITYPQDSAYSMAFRYDYVVVLRNKNRREIVREAENLILEERRAWFELGFEEEKVYPLPDGSEATLFRRRYRPPSMSDPESLYGVAGYLRQTAKTDDIVVAQPPALLVALLAHYWGPTPVATLGEEEVQAQHPHLFLVTDGEPEREVDDAIEDHYGPAIDAAELSGWWVTTYEPWGP
jgi:4-amino-4-deoxy-L-arabinose transferase-like glycosyltransferase